MAIEPIDMIPGFAFWREGCQTFAKNVVKALDLANKDWEREDLLRFIRLLPRTKSDVCRPEWVEGFCSQCLKKACENSPADYQVAEYFLNLPDRSYTAQAMLIDAFFGFVNGIHEATQELEGKKDERALET